MCPASAGRPARRVERRRSPGQGRARSRAPAGGPPSDASRRVVRAQQRGVLGLAGNVGRGWLLVGRQAGGSMAPRSLMEVRARVREGGSSPGPWQARRRRGRRLSPRAAGAAWQPPPVPGAPSLSAVHQPQRWGSAGCRRVPSGGSAHGPQGPVGWLRPPRPPPGAARPLGCPAPEAALNLKERARRGKGAGNGAAIGFPGRHRREAAQKEKGLARRRGAINLGAWTPRCASP